MEKIKYKYSEDGSYKMYKFRKDDTKKPLMIYDFDKDGYCCYIREFDKNGRINCLKKCKNNKVVDIKEYHKDGSTISKS